MNMTKMLAAGSAVALAATLGTAVVPANAAKGDKPLSEVIIDDNQFDNNGEDFDILTEAVLAVLDNKPDSAVSVLTDGDVKLTAFAPNDKAFKKLAKALTGADKISEEDAFAAVAGLGIDNVEATLLYHVVPGPPITAKKALKADGVKLETALGKNVKVIVKKKHSDAPVIRLKDKDPSFKNPKVIGTDVNKGNKQIAHVINNVLLPVKAASLL
jgi:uncharacterized surface protein with fasciclin (FAS1) repeats